MRTIGLMLVSFVMFAGPGTGWGQEAKVSRVTPVVKAYQKAQGSVVNLSGVRMVRARGLGGFLFPDFDFFGPGFERKMSILGSGVIVHEEGYIVTNAHVVSGIEDVKVNLSNGKEFHAKVIQAEPNKDLAVLKVESEETFDAADLGHSGDLMIGETVIAIGNPYGYTNTLSTGVISAIGRDIQVQEGFWLRGLIQTDAPINPGNSGGPLLNIYGELIGVNTAVRAEAENIGFAIPVDTLVDNIREMLMPEKLRRVSLGLNVGRRIEADGYAGLVVESVKEKSPAQKKGLSKEDVVTKMDGTAVRDVIDFYVRMIRKEPGEPIRIEYVRPSAGREVRRAELTLEERPIPDGNELSKTYFGLEASELNETLAGHFGFEGAYPIMIVTNVDNDGAAGEAGAEPGDLILSIDGEPVSNMKEFSLAMEKVSPGETADLRMMRITSSRGFGQIQRQFVLRLRAANGE